MKNDHQVTLDMIDEVMKSLESEELEAGDYSLLLSSAGYRDLHFATNLWSRIRRRFFGLSEREVSALIILHSPPASGD